MYSYSTWIHWHRLNTLKSTFNLKKTYIEFALEEKGFVGPNVQQHADAVHFEVPVLVYIAVDAIRLLSLWSKCIK